MIFTRLRTLPSSLTDIQNQEILATLLAKYAYKCGDSSKYYLSSGQSSNEYLDCGQALGRAEALQVLGKIVLPLLDPRVTAIGGLTMGADPIAIATSMASTINWFSVRKTAKSYGQQKLIEGGITPGQSIAITDDVVTTGKSVIQAIKACRDYGLHVVQVIILVDREQKGLQNIRAEVGESVPVTSVFTLSMIKTAYLRLQGHS